MKQIGITLSLMIFLTSISHAQWVQQTINTTADFRGLCAVTTDVAWVSGTKGTVGRTIDGGKSWEVMIIPGAEKLDFRDIEAFSANTAYALSIGPGDNSRIYKTVDGGKSWKLQFLNVHPDAFYDALAFWDEDHGVAMSDPVKGYYKLLATDYGGTTWKPLSTSKMPAALDGEGAYAASGTCLITHGKNDAWLVTGGAKAARVFHTRDRGQSWKVTDTPLRAGKESAGIFSIAFKDAKQGILVGGDYQKPGEMDRTLAITTNGGAAWKLVEKSLPFCSCVVWSIDRWIAVGTTGSFESSDGILWKQLDQNNYNVVSSAKDGTSWAAGPKGRIAKLVRP